MNITFMIGNGFDLNLNLKTRYSDFYNYYKNRSDNIISHSINEDYDRWADLESGLGSLLKQVHEKQIEEFLDSKADLESNLADYLTKESNRFTITDENKFVEEFRRKILNFPNGFCEEEKKRIENIVYQTVDRINYCFITFNYTTILDMMIKLAKSKYDILNVRSNLLGKYSDVLCLPLHIHGTLDGEDLILGVDNPRQIGNEAFQSDRRITDYMIKTNVNRSLGERKLETAKKIIDNSRCICLFGLSIGNTDLTWWQYLTEWLDRSAENRLVLFVKESSKGKRSGSEKVRTRDKYREYFGTQSGCLESKLYDKIKNKIIVVQNSDIFTYKNVAVEGEPNG